jgi:hypothetical protein
VVFNLAAAFASEDGSEGVMQSGQELLTSRDTLVRRAAFSLDGNRWTAVWGQSVKVWMPDRPGILTLREHSGHSVAFSQTATKPATATARENLQRHAAAGEALTARGSGAENRCQCRRRERPTLWAADLFSGTVSHRNDCCSLVHVIGVRTSEHDPFPPASFCFPPRRGGIL